jgi:anaerobic selenocysteine-containing dehydrogenase
LSTPNGARLSRALSKLDFMVSVDLYRNETTRHAHIILPPTSTLEQSHYDLAFNVFAVRNVAKYSPPLFPRPRGAKHDWEILLELTTRLAGRRGRRAAVAARAARLGLGRLGPDGILDQLLRWGPYGAKLGGRGLSLGLLKKHPHGLDLGPLEPALPDRLMTRDGRIVLVPPRFAADLSRLEASRDEPPPELALIGRRELRTNNSWLHNSPRMVKGPNRCTLMMHPDDAAARGLRDGAPVVVRSRVGEVTAPLQITDAIRPGVVSLPHGYGHDREDVSLSVARTQAPGVSVNDLTDDAVIDDLSGNAVLNGVPVEVTASAGTESNAAP